MAQFKPKDIQEANSERFLFDPWEIPMDWQAAYQKARDLIEAEGWTFKRRSGFTDHGRKFTMTLRKVIWVSASWDKYPAWKKAAILWHELVHVRQRKAWGHTKFLSRYATARGRWVIEVPAYRMSIRVYERLSNGDFNAAEYIGSKLNTFRQDYLLESLDFEQYKQETQKIWFQERR
jgi:hypothetical protein